MSEYDDVLCPICMLRELTVATKVYPLCECKLSICFDCLRRWAETKYCCPFCNIAFTQITLQQTEDELRVRLRGKVETDKLEEVVSAWAELLKHLRTEMEVGLTVLNMDSPGRDDDDGFYDLLGEPLGRSRTPFFPSNWEQISVTSSMFSNYTRNILLALPSVPNNGHPMLIVQPTLSVSSAQASNIQQGHFPPPQTFRNADNDELPGFSMEIDNSNFELGFNVNEKLRHSSSSNGQPTITNLGACFPYEAATVPGNIIRFEDISSQRLENDCSLRTDDLNLSTTPCKWVGRNLPGNRPPLSTCNLSTYSTSSKVEELIRKNGKQVKHILSKRLNVRWLVCLRPGTISARKYGSNAVGVIMKHVKEPDFGEGMEGFQQMKLSVRLLDGSWLVKVPVEDLRSKGRRATLTEWLRIGDILWTRYGVCIAKELHPNLGQVTVQFLGRFIDQWECSTRSRHVIYEELRSLLYNSCSPSRCTQGDELTYDRRSQKEEVKRQHKKLGHIVNTPLSEPKKYMVTPLSWFLSETDTEIPRRDAEEAGFLYDSDDIILPPPSLGKTERKSAPFEPHLSLDKMEKGSVPFQACTSKEDMEWDDIILENESTKIKDTVIPMLPKTNLGRTEKSSILFQPASPQGEIIETCSTSEKKDVERVLRSPPSGTKAKDTANFMLSMTNSDNSRSETLLLQPATPKWESETSLEDGTEEFFLPKSPKILTGLTFSSVSHVQPNSKPSHCKADTGQSCQSESDLPKFNLPPLGEDKPTVRKIYDTDIKTVLSAQDLIERIEKRAKRLEIIRNVETAQYVPIRVEIQSEASSKEL